MTTAPPAFADLRLLQQRHDVLLGLSDSLIACHDVDQLVESLSKHLGDLTRSDFFAIHLPNQASSMMVLHVAEVNGPQRFTYDAGIPIDQGPAGLVLRTQQTLNVPDYDAETRWPDARILTTSLGVKCFTMFPLTTARCRLGVMTFASRHVNIFSDEEAAFLAHVARHVAIALENVLNIAQLEHTQLQRSKERDRLRLILDLNNACLAHTDLAEMFNAFSGLLRSTLHHHYAALFIHDAKDNSFLLAARDTDLQFRATPIGTHFPIAQTPAGRAFTTGQIQIASEKDLVQWDAEANRLALSVGLRSFCGVRLALADRVLGAMSVGSTVPNAFDKTAVELLEQTADQLSIAVANALAFKQIEELRRRLTEEKLYLEDEVKTQYNFEEIVGKSAALSRVLKQVEVVADTDATVLITGETGTGKELIARAIHNRSPRRDHTFIKINCAAIPSALLESELFGHEKGAFTGAVARRVGRFELANGGTLFLDEVGDTPLDIQTKLLRVLQEREFERLGGSETIRTNVRVLAATNCDLDALVASRAFRADLFYRLNVFPIRMPPLRERLEDLPLLVRFFVERSARRMKKRIESVSSDSMDALARYHWPGNLRELENFVEHAVILSSGPTLQLPLAELNRAPAVPSPIASANHSNLEEAERSHILGALRDARWVIGGATGAAAKLGLKRTTLQSRMKKLGIERPV